MTHIINIGYEGVSSGILNRIPITLGERTVDDFALEIRDSRRTLFRWAKENHVPPSSIVIYWLIIDGEDCWEWKIKMMNVREYRAFWERCYKKKWIQIHKVSKNHT